MLQIFPSSSAAGGLVQGIRRIFNPDGVRREELIEEIRTNPQLASQYATAYRRQMAEMNNPDKANKVADAGHDFMGPLLTTLGLNPDNRENRVFLDALSLTIPESFDEQVETGRVQTPGLAQEVVSTERDVTKATGAEARARTSIAGNVQAEEEHFGSPGVMGPTRAAEARARKPEIEVELGELQAIFDQYKVTDAANRVSYWQDYNNWIAANPRMRGIAAGAMHNPDLMRHLLGMEELSLRESLALMASKDKGLKTRAEVMAETLDVFIKLQQLDEGTLKMMLGEGVSDEAKVVLGTRSEMVNALMEQIFPEAAGGFFTTEEPGGGGDVVGVAFRRRMVQRADGSNPVSQSEGIALGDAADEIEAAAAVARRAISKGDRTIREVVDAMREQELDAFPGQTYWQFLEERNLLTPFMTSISRAEHERVTTPEQRKQQILEQLEIESGVVPEDRLMGQRE